ncbi:hypothetical protein GCM10010168_30330 [Actinoplanes ianthinogenes]|uniref:Uncharacterized protein n=1 Tax=Actinoplanes ianthinogenes TaxID=122358 RepID=A0ABM7LLR3_9ACTN|nr:hypothetical protein [Actinoplanes ianthinogenes]BCJ40175.1 hypothetical protein Aiant_08320 [Actinoplanes ianthinogenes]GGR10756.1 hypothetical protein GCM10010168_30330 [Actinoplanes ianthinogenes]
MSRSRYRAQAFPRFNRRRMLALTAAGVGVSAVSVAGLSLAGENETTSANNSPLIVSVRDAKKGTIDLFSGDSKKTVTDKKLAAQLLKHAGR